MPRIDPLQLLNCLSVLLSPKGGIQSKDEVQRLANLMTKFSKKLVSKCIYILILKNTDEQLIGAFMKEGGWPLIHVWLQDAMCTTNKPLLKELLELLLITPVDVDRLKSNSIPKLVKTLSKREDLDGVHQLANQLVQQWLKIVKEETKSEMIQVQVQQVSEQIPKPVVTETIQVMGTHEVPENKDNQCEQTVVATTGNSNATDGTISTTTFYKLSVRDGKQVISRFPQTINVEEETTIDAPIDLSEESTVIPVEEDKEKKESDKKKEKSNHERSRHKSSSSKSSSSSSKSSSKDKRRDRDRSSSSSSSSKDKDRHRKNRDKDRHRNNGSIKHSNSSSKSSSGKDKKENKEKQAEKDKDTLAKIQPQILQKIGRIPKKSSDDKPKKEKPSISIEVRKNNEERPKTVKVFNAKMRSTGLEEEVKPPPPRSAKKIQPVLPVIPPPKRSSPIRDAIPPPEKKSKLELPERPGAIKLIPPKPKPAILQESDIFMDALTAATTKKEPKKRKRRPSVLKDSNTTVTTSPPQSPSVTTPTSSPLALKNIAPPKFYQETLETTDEKIEEDKSDEKKTDDDEEDERATTPVDNIEDKEEESEEPKPVYNNGIRSVLSHSKRKGPKKSIRWKSEADLVEIQYFELDETERVNVTKTFMDMAKMEVSGEREALQMSRKLPNEDLMDAQTPWRIPIIFDLPPPLAQPGCKSLEKDIQFAREKSVLQALYFNKKMVPDSPAEPEPENHIMTDPVLIPLEDPDNNNETDLRNTPWPEPKGSPPREANVNVPPIFQNIQNTFPNFSNIPPPNFQNQGPPFSTPGGFMPPNIITQGGGVGGGVTGGSEWNNMNNNQIIAPNMPPPELINQVPINPNHIFGPGPGGPGPDNFNAMINDNGGFPPMQFNQPNMGMFPPNFNMNRGGGNRGFRRGSGGGPWIRMGGPGGWNRGGGHRGGRICKNVKNHGYCRNRDNCPFMHPN